MRIDGHNIAFESLTEPDALGAASFAEDEVGKREFGRLYGNHPKWWSLVDNRTRFGWTIRAHGLLCGFVDLEIHEDSSASLALYVKRAYRNRGVGRTILRNTVPIAHSLGATNVFGTVNPANQASLRAA